MATVYVNGITKNARNAEVSATVRSVFLKTTGNLSWLKKGQTVLVKPALNSPDPYPATTDPVTLLAVVRLLEEKGARVVVGDQSGIEHVIHGPRGVIKGSSRDLFFRSGMGKSSIRFVGFEQEGWNEGFFRFTSPQTTSWKNGFYVTNWIKKADHIVSLPRLSTHAQAGVTLGFKSFVGLLREDSRMEFHASGPFALVMKHRAAQIGAPFPEDETGSFFRKITEISLALRDKLRVTLITATKAQTTIGPDARTGNLIPSHIATPDTGLIIASADQIAAEVFSIAYLTCLYATETPMYQKALQKFLTKINGQTRELGTQSPWDHPFVGHALKLHLGSRNLSPDYSAVPSTLQERLNDLLLN